jgi:hypothetical protein
MGFLDGIVVEVGFRGGKVGFSGFMGGLGVVGVCCEGWSGREEVADSVYSGGGEVGFAADSSAILAFVV